MGVSPTSKRRLAVRVRGARSDEANNACWILELVRQALPSCPAGEKNDAFLDVSDPHTGAFRWCMESTLLDTTAGSQAFAENCELINPRLPRVWREVVSAHFSHGQFDGATTPMWEVRDWLIERNPCGLTRPEAKYPYMLKEFLRASYCGLTASTLWDGRSTVGGGLLTIDADDKLVAFDALDSEAFRSYLFDHCRIEFPDTSSVTDINFRIRFSSR